MKPKLTLLIGVLAIVLFGMGCKTTEEPSPKYFNKSLRGFK